MICPLWAFLALPPNLTIKGDVMLSTSLKARLITAAQSAAPAEICGLILTGETPPQLVPLPNQASDPTCQFELAAADFAPYADRVDVALYHSHPNGPPYPSEADLALAQHLARPCFIIALSPEAAPEIIRYGPPQPLDLPHRIFRHGVTDCYGLIRDYYHETYEITLPDQPRRWGWWDTGDDFYRDQFAAFGFEQLAPETAPQTGDIFVAQMRSPVPNHGGIYVGGGLILHHPAGQAPLDHSRLARTEPLLRYRPFIVFWLRYHAPLPDVTEVSP